MNSGLKYGLIGISAYLLYRHYTDAAAPTTTTATTPATTTATTPAANTAATTRQMLMTATGGARTLSFHQWNFYYRAVRGTEPPAPEAAGMGDGTRLITVDEYLAAIATVGLSGIIAYRRPVW